MALNNISPTNSQKGCAMSNATLDTSEKTIRVLSIDGGGIRGILPACVLREIEARTGKDIASLFHLIAGTSTGGIIACGLLHGVPADKLRDLYVKDGGNIFSHSGWRTMETLWSLNGPKYSAENLDSTLKRILGDTWLSKTSGPELLVPSYCITLPEPIGLDGDRVRSTRMPFLFKSWKARGTLLDPGDVPAALDFKLLDIARATSAAPTYFPPAKIKSRNGDVYWMADGGVFANNPAMCALVSARRIFPGVKRCLVVSLGTGCLEHAMDGTEATKWGEVAWLHPILSLLMDGNADTVCYQLDQLLRDDHRRFQISLGSNPNDEYAVQEDMDQATPDNIQRLLKLAGKLIEDEDANLNRLCNELKRPKSVIDIKKSKKVKPR